MGARPSSFRKGGGFLNNVDGLWVDYRFTDEFNGEPFTPGKVRDAKTGQLKDKFHALYGLITVQVDGAEEPITTSLFVGGAEDFDVSEDGHTLTPVEGSGGISATSAWGRFVASICEAGFDENQLPGDDEPINYEAMLGSRYRFVQRENPEDTKRLGKRRDKRTGREYSRQDLVVEAILDGGQVAVAAARPAVKTAARPVSKGVNGKGSPQDAVAAKSIETLQQILKANKGQIAKSKISMKVLNLLARDAMREPVRKWLNNDDNLGGIPGISYDSSSEDQIVSLG